MINASCSFLTAWLQVGYSCPQKEKKIHKDGCVSVFPLSSISFSVSEWAGLLKDVSFLQADSCLTSGSGLQTPVMGDQGLGSGGLGVIRVIVER